MNELLPLLYLKGLSTNDFIEALTPLVGDNAKKKYLTQAAALFFYLCIKLDTSAQYRVI